MLLVVTTREHPYTHQWLRKEAGIDLLVATYDEVLRRTRPYQATHIFTDFERLPPWRLREAALLYRSIKAAGLSALNDPARAFGRFGLLRALHQAEINRFNAYRVDEIQAPRQWPVFLRLEGDHGSPVSGLLHNQADLDLAIESAIKNGAPVSALLVIEYAAEPVRPGLFRKLSVFRIGDRVLGYPCVHEDNWLVKYGKPGIATPDLYEEEYAFVETNSFGTALMPAFEIAGVEYGRMDFGIVEGRPQIYEINSNPHVELRPPASPEQRRNDSVALFSANYIDAMKAIDSIATPAWQLQRTAMVRSLQAAPSRAGRSARRAFCRLFG